jgi:DNA-binding NarL/FixJ family response regulator
MRLVIADAHSQVRWALRTALGEDPRLTIVDEVADVDDLLARASALSPDLVLLEWELVVLADDGLLQRLRNLGLPLRIIVLGRQPEARAAALRDGADAFISKSDPPERLLHTIRELVEEANSSQQKA